MKSFALSILCFCVLMSSTAEAAKKGRGATKAAKPKAKANKPKGKAHKSPGPKKKGGKAKGPKKATAKRGGAGKAGPKKKPGATARAKKPGATAKKANKPGAGGPRKKTGGKAGPGKKANASHVAPRKHKFSPKRAGPNRAQQAKNGKALGNRRQKALGKLPPAQRKKAQNALRKAQQGKQRARRPRGAPGVARKNPVKVAPGGRGRRALRLPAGPARKALLNGPGKSTIPGEKGLANRILRNRPLTPADRRLARNLLKNGLAAANPNRPLLNALRHGLNADLSRRFLGRTLQGLIRLGGDTPGFLVNPGGTLADPLFIGEGGVSFKPPPGFDPSVAAVVDPEDANNPNGPAIISSLDPDSLGFAPTQDTQADEDPGDTTDDPDIDQPSVDSVWQVARTVKVVNASPSKIKVFVRYEAQDEDGMWESYPDESKGEKFLVYEIDPGEVTILKDGDWEIATRRLHIWAEGDSRKWLRYKTQELSVVPEPDNGYPAPRIQTFNVAFR